MADEPKVTICPPGPLPKGYRQWTACPPNGAAYIVNARGMKSTDTMRVGVGCSRAYDPSRDRSE